MSRQQHPCFSIIPSIPEGGTDGHGSLFKQKGPPRRQDKHILNRRESHVHISHQGAQQVFTLGLIHLKASETFLGNPVQHTVQTV